MTKTKLLTAVKTADKTKKINKCGLKPAKKSELIKTLKAIINKHDSFRGSYFWQGNNKSKHLNFEDKYTFEVNDIKFEIKQRCSSSAKNVYYSLVVYLNDTKKDIRALKKLITLLEGK